MTEQQIQKIIQNIDIDSIVENVKTALLGVMSAFNDIMPILKENIENGVFDEEAKKVVIEKLIEQLQAMEE